MENTAQPELITPFFWLAMELKAEYPIGYWKIPGVPIGGKVDFLGFQGKDAIIVEFRAGLSTLWCDKKHEASMISYD